MPPIGTTRADSVEPEVGPRRERRYKPYGGEDNFPHNRATRPGWTRFRPDPAPPRDNDDLFAFDSSSTSDGEDLVQPMPSLPASGAPPVPAPWNSLTPFRDDFLTLIRRDAQVQTALAALKEHEDSVKNMEDIQASLCAQYREYESSKLDCLWQYAIAVWDEERAKTANDTDAVTTTLRQQRIAQRAFLGNQANSAYVLGQFHSCRLIVRSMLPKGRELCDEVDRRRNEYYDKWTDILADFED